MQLGRVRERDEVGRRCERGERRDREEEVYGRHSLQPKEVTTLERGDPVLSRVCPGLKANGTRLALSTNNRREY